MSDYLITPNMNLLEPIVGQDPGPTYAENINASLVLIDQHDHTAGKGVQLTPSAFNINSDMAFGGNNATNLRSVRFNNQVAPLALAGDVGCIYESGGNFYYNNSAGTAVQITSGGSIVGTAGSITGLPSGTASASYAAGTFIWQSATSTSAVMDFGSAILRNNVANSKGLTLNPPNAMAADYSLTLPSLPISTKIMSLDTSGNMTAQYSVDNSTIEISSNLLQVKDGGITNAKMAANSVGTSNIIDLNVTTAKIADGAVTKAKQASVGQQISGGSGAYTTSSSTDTTVTNLSVTITTIGRPVQLALIADISGESWMGVSGTVGICYVSIYRDSSAIAVSRLRPSDGGSNLEIPVSGINHLDPVGVGTWNYTIQVRCTAGATIHMEYAKLVAYEL
jgi:hypothetical protein